VPRKQDEPPVDFLGIVQEVSEFPFTPQDRRCGVFPARDDRQGWKLFKSLSNVGIPTRIDNGRVWFLGIETLRRVNQDGGQALFV
jgi:hypothetical protein